MSVTESEAPISPLDAALSYAARGWPVFPIHGILNQTNKGTGEVIHRCGCGQLVCPRPGKHPSCKNGLLDASLDSSKIYAWFGVDGKRKPNVGIRTGGDDNGPGRKLFVLDIDPDRDGDVSLSRLEEMYGKLPDTYRVITGSGGTHFYFEYAPALSIKNSVNLVADGIDVRADGGYAVAPPSRHESGNSYLVDLGGVDVVAALPEWVMRLATARAEGKPGRTADWEKVTGASSFIAGARNTALTSISGSLRFRNVPMATALIAIIGTNRQKCVPPLDEAEVKSIVEGIYRRYQPGDRTLNQISRDGVTGPAGEWTAELVVSPQGTIRDTGFNACLILRHAEEWKNVLSFDAFDGSILWRTDAPLFGPNDLEAMRPKAGEKWSDTHYLYVQHWLLKKYATKFKKEEIYSAVTEVARSQTFHPVADWLRALEWDQKPRLDTWLSVYLGAVDTPYTKRVGAAFLVSAVARAFAPGSQVDHTLVLEGDQGVGKTTAMERLFSTPWYRKNLPNLNQGKDVQIGLRGCWGVEIGELDALRGVAMTRVKAFLTETVDRYRPPYGRVDIPYPRSCVFVATTNEYQWLTDATGGRRFWPIRVGVGITAQGLGIINFARLGEDRNQLWAEAVARHTAGETWWPQHGELEVFSAEQEARFLVDDWEDRIGRHLIGQDVIESKLIYTQCLSMPVGQIDRTTQGRVGAIMNRLGWDKRRVRVRGARVTFYYKHGTGWETSPDDAFTFSELKGPHNE